MSNGNERRPGRLGVRTPRARITERLMSDPKRIVKKIKRLEAAIADPATKETKREQLKESLRRERERLEPIKAALKDAGLLE